MLVHSSTFFTGELVLKKDLKRKKKAGGKMDARYVGPYVITKKLGKGVYALRDVADTALDPVINKVSGAHLKPYKKQQPNDAKDKESSDRVSLIENRTYTY